MKQKVNCEQRDTSKNYIKSNLFFHINQKGDNAYQKKYTYTGDYKYGVAVVVNESGLSTHIDTKGKSIHGKYFLQLSVYHKGYAIAKDEYGYFHIDKQGKEIYSNRFSEISQKIWINYLYCIFLKLL
ncbi:MAG: hypothetical protein OMM_10564 [Candidatus Magnetoglobus multicellularis str. Araruama]|uniref:Uncharacterized protein n=1 Tax=Candidatus Magnetoglobus multicellularis str. Araruama TaxID=890399 RepID=A0A1V1P0Q7_9BACT|nr:MAG: hypothetical protein OMM_10564 [Candidatus Magnetoglobus multicellularis str. Araruama]